MTRKKKIDSEEKVIVTLGGCSLYGKVGRIISKEIYGQRVINLIEVDGKTYRVNERFCRALNGKSGPDKEKVEQGGEE